MAQVKTDGSIVEMRGQFGGVYFKGGKHGIQVQAMPRSINYARAGLQAKLTGDFTGAAEIWMLALLGAFAAAWAAYALIYYFTDKRGESKRISGYNWYIHYAMTFPETDRHPLWRPPPSPYWLYDYIIIYEGYKAYFSTPEGWDLDCCQSTMNESVPWNGKPSYKGLYRHWFLWWKDPVWVISPVLGGEPAGKTFYSPGDEIEANFINPVTGHSARAYSGLPPD